MKREPTHKIIARTEEILCSNPEEVGMWLKFRKGSQILYLGLPAINDLIELSTGKSVLRWEK